MNNTKSSEPLFIEGEIWKSVVGYEDFYEVSNFGRVKNKQHRNGQHFSNVILKQRQIKSGYWGLDLHKNGKKTFILTHRIVYEAFVGRLPKWNAMDKGDVKMEINHKDENKSNNRLENLELITKTQNNNYGTRIKRQAAKLSKTVYQYDFNGVLIKVWASVAETQKCGFNQGTVAACCRGVKKQHKGYIWSYVQLN